MAVLVVTDQIYDLQFTLDDGQVLGLMLAADPDRYLDETDGPTDETADDQPRRVTKTWDNWSEGGYGIDYEDGSFVWTRSEGWAGPAGYMEEVSLPPGPTKMVRASHNFNSIPRFYTGIYCYRFDSGPQGPATLEGLANPAPSSDHEVVSAASFYGQVWLGAVNSSGIGGLYAFGGTYTGYAAVTRSQLAVCTQIIDGVAQHRLFGCTGNNTFKFVTSDPSVGGNWSAEYTVGENNAYHVIRHIIPTPRRPYFLKNTGLFDATPGAVNNFSNLTPYWLETQGAFAGEAGLFYAGKIVIANHQSLEAVDVVNHRAADGPSVFHPGQNLGASNEGLVVPPVRALAIHNGYLVAAFWTGADSYIMTYRDGKWYGPEANFTNQAVTHIALIYSGDRPYIFYWTLSGTTVRCYRQDLPVGDGPLQDYHTSAATRFMTSWWISTKKERFGASGSKKVFDSLALQGDNLGSGNSLADYVQIDDGTETLLGTASTSPIAVFGAGTGLESGYKIKHRIVGSNSQSSPSILRSIKTVVDVLEDQLPTRQYHVLIQRGQKLRNGSTDDRTQTATHRLLRSIQGKILTLVDETGTSLKVKIRPGLKTRRVRPTDKRTDRTQTQPWAQLVTLSVTVEGTYSLWDTGLQYDTAVEYA